MLPELLRIPSRISFSAHSFFFFLCFDLSFIIFPYFRSEVDCDVPDSHGRTPLMEACKAGSIGVVGALVKQYLHLINKLYLIDYFNDIKICLTCILMQKLTKSVYVLLTISYSHKLLSTGASGMQFECPRPQRVVSVTPRCGEGMYYSCEVSLSSEPFVLLHH